MMRSKQIKSRLFDLENGVKIDNSRTDGLLPVVSLPGPVCLWLPFPAFFVFSGFGITDPPDPKQKIKINYRPLKAPDVL